MSDSGAPRRSFGPLARPAVRLFLTSFALLYVELLLIRWIPANVKYVGFFTNFLLMASFLGIGLGILLGRHGRNPRIAWFTLLLAALVAAIRFFELNVKVVSQDEILFGLAESREAYVNFIVLPLLVGLVVAVMATLALPLGPLLKRLPPLQAYAVDIAGSMSGIASFTILSAAGTDPAVWFAIAALLFAALELGRGVSRWTVVNAAAVVAVAAIVALQAVNHPDRLWSPYYRIDFLVDGRPLTHVMVDGIPHQALWDADTPDKEEFYEQIYRWFPDQRFPDVLVVGAGSGVDLAVALREGAERIDAVEIDPRIQQIGVELNPDGAYLDPRVSRHVNDGRAFLRTTDRRYDLVVFALPDSLTRVSSQAALRLESFLFTEEALASVRDHLAPGGVFVLYNYFRDPWLIAKLSGMLEGAFGHQPLLRTYAYNRAALAAGPLVAALPGGTPPGDAVDPVPTVGEPAPQPATDDWPFLYLRTPFIAPYYLAALAVILGVALGVVLGAARVTSTPIRRFSPHFFVLGIAFLLLTTRSLVSFSLLFGTTWLVNSMAFFAILASVLLAILVNSRWRVRNPGPFYLALFASIAVAYLVRPETLLVDPPFLRYALAAALAFAPIFFANLVFSHSFRDTRTADMAFASNLLGAMVGGALEYVALLTGYSFLLVIVAGLYVLAWLFASRLRVLADRELDDSGPAVEPINEAATV